MHKWAPQSFNDTLTLVLVPAVLLFVGWCFDRGFSGEVIVMVISQLIAILLLVGQYYYRKKSGETDGTPPPTPPAQTGGTVPHG